MTVNNIAGDINKKQMQLKPHMDNREKKTSNPEIVGGFQKNNGLYGQTLINSFQFINLVYFCKQLLT